MWWKASFLTLALSCAKAPPQSAAPPPTPRDSSTEGTTVAPTPTSPPAIEVPDDLYGVVCKGQPTPFGDLVMPIAEDLQAQKIWYSKAVRDDCSGIYQRVLKAYNEQCPGQTLPSLESPPPIAKQFGLWYHEQGLLKIVGDPVKEDRFIHPGSVVFFAKPGRNYAAMEPEDAIDKIHHIGIVVETTRNEDGTLHSYRLFHGRKPKTYATITNWHKRSSRTPFGNGDDVLMAVGPMAKPLGDAVLETLGVPPPPGDLRMTCKGERTMASELITPIAESLRGKEVRVRWKNERDKVRVFMVLAERVAQQCPELHLPPEERQVSHEEVAQWYVSEGRMEAVEDARDQGAWIVPGSVMFYGPADLDYASMDVEDRIAAINHMAVVVSVTRNEAGEVATYTVYQAPPEGAYKAEFAKGNPLGSALPFGLKGEAWLAVAPIQADGGNE